MAARLVGGGAFAGALAALALVALLAWGASPYARYLDHAHQPGAAAAIAVYLAGWLLMTAAMMLPTATGLVRAFDRVTGGAAALRLALVAGFLGVWLLVGYAFRAGDVLVHAAVDAAAAPPSLVGAAALALAGAYQFSPLKHRCLTACRSPRSFVLRGWTGGRRGVDALRVGAAYGRSCAGCCWALMLVMFGVGAASLAWMLGLAAVMVAERFAPARWRVGEAVGVALLALAAASL
jgi:predicted metal-binding membrane protein